MRWMKRGGKHTADKLDREIAFHLEEQARAHMQAGMPAEEARRRARIAFGGAEQVRQQLREIHTPAVVSRIVAHARAAVRFVRRAPAFPWLWS